LSRLLGIAVGVLAPLAVALAPPARASGSKADEILADRAEIQRYRLTSPTMTKVEKVYTALEGLLAASPGLREELAALDPMQGLEDSRPTLAHSVARIGAVSPVQKAITDAGLQPHEFMVFGYALAGTLFSAALAADKPMPKDAPAVLAANVKWYETNKLQVKHLQSEINRIFPEDESSETGSSDTSAAVEGDSDVDIDSVDSAADSVATE
jgi:hypothetical protein